METCAPISVKFHQYFLSQHVWLDVMAGCTRYLESTVSSRWRLPWWWSWGMCLGDRRLGYGCHYYSSSQPDKHLRTIFLQVLVPQIREYNNILIKSNIQRLVSLHINFSQLFGDWLCWLLWRLTGSQHKPAWQSPDSAVSPVFPQ